MMGSEEKVPELMSASDALERWPVEDYPADSVGGKRRDLIVRFWQLVDETVESTGGHPFVMDWLAGCARSMAESEARLDTAMEDGLRRVFSRVMGYELPGQ